MQIPYQFLHVLGYELLHMILNEEYVCVCTHVDILTLITDKMIPPPHIYTRFLSHPCPLRLPNQNACVERGTVPCSQGMRERSSPVQCMYQGIVEPQMFSGMASHPTPEGVLSLLPFCISKESAALHPQFGWA